MKIECRYLVADTDRHGNKRLYVRRSGRKIRIREPMGSQAFAAAYERAVERLSNLTLPKDDDAPTRGTVGWLGACYFASGEFASLEPQTQRVIRGTLESCFREPHRDDDPTQMGFCPLEHFGPSKVKRLRDLKRDKPGAANGRRKWLSAMFNWAVDQTPPLVTTNPVRDVKRIKYATDGFHTWTESEIEAFEQRHPIGTRARLAMALLLFTGVRRSDLVRLGPEHVVNGWLRFVPHKTRKKRPGVSEKPWLPVLAEIVAASPCGKKTFLETNRHGPFQDNAFSSWFGARCAEAGIPHCTAHGLRKAGAARAAESGATINQLMAVFDWLTPAMAKIYTDKADRKRMSGQAMALLSEKRIHFSDNAECPTGPSGGVPPTPSA
jgi:integrase